MDSLATTTILCNELEKPINQHVNMNDETFSNKSDADEENLSSSDLSTIDSRQLKSTKTKTFY